MKLFILIFVTLSLSLLQANSAIGSVAQIQGVVKVKSSGSIKKSKLKVDAQIVEGDLVTTSRKASITIKLKDGSLVSLDKSSTVHFQDNNSISQMGGKIYYKIVSRNSSNSLKVKTPFAVIGIKGTTFIIDNNNSGSVALKEGLIGVASIKEEFNLYREKVMGEYEKFKAQQKSGFEAFKNSTNSEFVGKVASFDLKENKTVTFGENRVDQNEWTKDDDAEFDHFEKLMEQLK